MIKLFNAVRAAQTEGGEWSRAVKSEGFWDCKEEGERYDISPIWVLGSGPITKGVLSYSYIDRNLCRSRASQVSPS